MNEEKLDSQTLLDQVQDLLSCTGLMVIEPCGMGFAALCASASCDQRLQKDLDAGGQMGLPSWLCQ